MFKSIEIVFRKRREAPGTNLILTFFESINHIIKFLFDLLITSIIDSLSKS